MFQLLSAIGYLQARKVVHRGEEIIIWSLIPILDLKLENILIDKDDNLKIGDFGWAVHNINNSRNTICGTIDCISHLNFELMLKRSCS